MKRQPWMKFFPQDWLGDAKLRSCSPLARALWMDMICIMHEAQPRGFLLINGSEIGPDKLSRMTGIKIDAITSLVDEMEDCGVFSRNRAGVIYSRRIVNDEKKIKKARINGQRGGNPSLRKQRAIPASDNPDLTKGDKAHMPEARTITNVIASDEEKSEREIYLDRAIVVIGGAPKPACQLAEKLLKAKSGSIPLARAALEVATTTDNPRAYVASAGNGKARQYPVPDTQYKGPIRDDGWHWNTERNKYTEHPTGSYEDFKQGKAR